MVSGGAYRPRVVDSQVRDELQTFGAIELCGPKWCGKTTTAEEFCSSAVYMNDSVRRQQNLRMAELEPARILRGPAPRLIDEWQMAPHLWDVVKFDVDHSEEVGKYILTGSAKPDMDGIRDIGAGRFSSIRMRTMSLWESGDSTGEVSLSALFDKDLPISGFSEHSLEDVSKLLVRGGWPSTVGKSEMASHKLVRAYCEAILRSKVSGVPDDGSKGIGGSGGSGGGSKRDIRSTENMRRVLRSISRNVGGQVPDSTILEDINERQTFMHRNTLSQYLRVLREVYVLEDLPAWTPALRSKTTIRTSDTRHLSDPAVSAYFLDALPEDLLNDLNTFGLLFESMVVRDLRVYSQPMEGRVSHYRDKDGLEADSIIHVFGGKWAAMEVKLGSDTGIEEGAKNLRALRDKVDSSEMNPPSFLAVVTATGYAYTRPDGVHVIPIGCLRP